jgi:hypothetical protein
MTKKRLRPFYAFMVLIGALSVFAGNAYSSNAPAGHDKKGGHCITSPLNISEVGLDVRRIDLCLHGKCAAVAGERQIDLIRIAQGNIDALGEILLFENLERAWNCDTASLKLVIGRRNYIVADGVRYPLYVPGGYSRGIVLKEFKDLTTGFLSSLLLDFDPARHIKVFHDKAFFTRKQIKVLSYQTTPFEAEVEVIRPQTGGSLKMGGYFELYIPPHALAAATAFWVNKSDAYPLTPLFTVGPQGLALLKEAEVKIRYRPETLPPGFPENELVILHDGAPVPTTVDLGRKQLSAGISPLSTLRGAPAHAATYQVADGVEYIDRSMEDPAVHVVTIDRSLTNYELRVIADLRSSGRDVDLQTVKTLAATYNALVAINGYTWDGDSGGGSGQTGDFLSTSIMDWDIKRYFSKRQSMIGFALQDGSSIRAMRFPSEDYDLGYYPDFRYHLLGSETSIMKNGECYSEGVSSKWSAIGYSASRVVMISADMSNPVSTFNDERLCNLFRDYGATDAVRLDGGGSPSLVVDGVHKNPLGWAWRGWGYDVDTAKARYVADAIALVPVEAPLETIVVPVDGSVVASHNTYSSAQNYRIQVSGCYIWGNCDPYNCPNSGSCTFKRFGDAEWITDDCWSSHYNSFYGWHISLFMDGQDVQWGPYTDKHIYTVTRPGNNGLFRFHIYDCPPCYGDNAGHLIVKIFAQ